MSYKACPTCKQYRFTDPHHKCPPIWECQIETWNAPDWRKIFAVDSERAAEKFVEEYDQEDHYMMDGDSVEVSVRNSKGAVEIYNCTGETIPTYYAHKKEPKK